MPYMDFERFRFWNNSGTQLTYVSGNITTNATPFPYPLPTMVNDGKGLDLIPAAKAKVTAATAYFTMGMTNYRIDLPYAGSYFLEASVIVNPGPIYSAVGLYVNGSAFNAVGVPTVVPATAAPPAAKASPRK